MGREHQHRARQVKGGRYHPHRPVMAGRVIRLLCHDPEGEYLDATAGGGGHAAELLKHLGPQGRIIAFDRDTAAVNHLEERFAGESRVRVCHADFADCGRPATRLEPQSLAGVLFDFGVSSHQLEGAPERGFSYRESGPLDMRMNPEDELTAWEVVNEYPPEKLRAVLHDYGEEPNAGKITAAIVRSRPVPDTGRLAGVVAGCVHPGLRTKTLSRVFQAIRIEVNGELKAIRSALPESLKLLVPGGRLVAMSYHSLEDRLVKDFIRSESRDCICPPRQPVCTCGGENARLRPLTKGALKASGEEIEENPRARSVRVRAAERIR